MRVDCGNPAGESYLKRPLMDSAQDERSRTSRPACILRPDQQLACEHYSQTGLPPSDPTPLCFSLIICNLDHLDILFHIKSMTNNDTLVNTVRFGLEFIL